MKKLLLSASLFLSCGALSYGQTAAFSWKNASDGAFEDAAMWDPAGFNADGANLALGLAGSYRVTLGQSLDANSLSIRGSSGTVTLDFGTRKLTLSSVLGITQNTEIVSGQIHGTLQLGLAASNKTLAISGIGTEVSASSNIAIGRNSATVAATNNTATLTGGAVMETTGSVIIGENNRDGAVANGNSLSVSGVGTRLEAGSLLVGSLAGNSSTSAANDNTLTVGDRATVQVGALTVGRRAPSVTHDAVQGNKAIIGSGAVLTATGVVAIGSGGGGNVLKIEENGQVNATRGASRIFDGTGNALIIDSGRYVATGQKMTTYGNSNITLSGTGNLTVTTLELQSTLNVSGKSTLELSRLLLQESSVINVTIGSATDYAQINTTSFDGLAFDGAFNLTFEEGYEAVAGQQYKLFSFTSASGEFTQLELPDLASGLQWDTSQLYQTGTIAVIPEAKTTALTATALLAFAAFSSKRLGRMRLVLPGAVDAR